MRKRLIQVLAKFIAAGAMPIALWLGGEAADEGTIMELSTSIAAGVVGLLALLADLLIHKVSTGGIFTDAGEQTVEKQLSRGARSLLPAAALLPALALGGCASNAVDEYYTARDTLTTTQQSILRAHDAGQLSDEELVAMDEYVQAARASLAQVRQRLPEDEEGLPDPDGEMPEQSVDWYLDTVQGVLDRLIQRFEQMEARDGPDDDPSDSGTGAGLFDRRPPHPGVGSPPARPVGAGWRADAPAA